jgi:exosome complex component RRP41
MPRSDEVCLLQMDGSLTGEEFEKAFKLAIEGCRKVYLLQRETLKKKYASAKEAIDEESEKTEEGSENK